MKRILFIFCLSFFLTGCTVNYDLEVDDEKIIEKININVNDLSQLGHDGYSSLTSKTNTVYFKEKEYYNVNFTEQNGGLSSTFDYAHNFERYNNASVLDLCYPERKISKENGKIIISTSGSLECAMMEYSEDITNANINIKTDLKVLENNADKVDGNVYTWNINKSNYLNKPIYIEMKVANEPASFTQKLFIGVSFIALIGILIFIVIRYKNKQNNII